VGVKAPVKISYICNCWSGRLLQGEVCRWRSWCERRI